ncbi:conserved hypothetical protein [Hyphomicrobiales bacterium]|nr:conserved hypothetical protein [Hyphomicrobiales bacterium]CAH1667707.1 conserved hypothetical protein [Hyphomicrobiales bacterium]
MTPERDGFSRIDAAYAIEPATLSADSTPATVDMKGARRATLLLGIGAGGITFTGTNKIEFVLTHSDDNVTYTPVVADDLIVDALAPASITDGVVRALIAAHAAATLQKVGYIGGKRYLKLLADFSGTHGTGTPISAVVVRSDLDLQRVA